MTTAAELVGEDLQDGADVNIVDDNFAIEPGRVQDDRWQQVLMHFL